MGEENFPIRYSTMIYLDVLAFGDSDHEEVCEYLKSLLETSHRVNNVDIGEC